MKYNFFKTPSVLFETCGDLNDGEKLGLMVLLKYSDKQHKCFPSYNKIAELLGKTRNTAIRIIRGLVQKSYIYKKIRFSRKYNKVFNTSNEYTINISKILGDSKNPDPITQNETLDILDIAEEVFKEKNIDESLKATLQDKFLETYNSKNIRNPKKYLETMIDNELTSSKSINYKSSNILKTKFHNFEERNDYSEEDCFNILTKGKYSKDSKKESIVDKNVKNNLSKEIINQIDIFIKEQLEFVTITDIDRCRALMIKTLEKEKKIDRVTLMSAFSSANS